MLNQDREIADEVLGETQGLIAMQVEKEYKKFLDRQKMLEIELGMAGNKYKKDENKQISDSIKKVVDNLEKERNQLLTIKK